MNRFTFGPGIPPVAHAILATAALAAGPGAVRAEGLSYSIGLYAGATTSPFEKNRTTALVVPDFLIEGESFSFGTSGLTFDLLDTGAMTLSARLAPRFVTDRSNVPGLEHMKRDIAVEAGLAASVALGQFQLEIEALKDVSDTHDGMAVTASVGTNCPVSDRFSIGLRAGATWMDKKLATYSYGVLQSEARGGLAAYEVNDSVIPSIGIDANFALSEHTAIVGSVTAEFLPDSVTASPIVREDTVISAMVGLRYAF